MVSFDGRQKLTVDLQPLYDHVVSTSSEVDDISLRVRTRRPTSHLMTSSSRHVTSDLLTVAIADGRISVDIRTAVDRKVLTIPCVDFTARRTAKRARLSYICPSVTRYSH